MRFRALGLLGAAVAGAAAVAGSLTPPAVLGPTMKTLAEIEPRGIVNNLPGNAAAVHVISQPGSYYLTDSVMGVGGKHGILITASQVTLDLRGFTVGGVAGSLDGITTDNAITVERIIVRNGIVRDWGQEGVNLQFVEMGDIEEIRVTSCTGDAFALGYGFTVSQCNARENGGDGFVMFSNGVIENCSSRQNGGVGYDLATQTVARACTSFSNGVAGFDIGRGVSMTECTSNGDQNNAVIADIGCSIQRCTFSNASQDGVLLNGDGNLIADCSINDFGGYGVKAEGSGNTIRGLNIANCGAQGVWIDDLSTGNRIEHNNAWQCGTGFFLDGGGNYFVRNNGSDSTLLNFNVSTSQAYGEILFIAGPAPITATTGSWANIAH